MSNKKKKKKVKTIYIDDGRSLADMSGIRGGFRGSGRSLGKGTFKDQARTYFAACRMMFIPMLVVIAIISAAFALVYLLLTLG